MNAKQAQKSSLSFLERFQGKKSTITKEGLHHLFEQEIKKNINTNTNSIKSDQKKVSS